MSFIKSSAGRYVTLSSEWLVDGSNTFQTNLMYQWQFSDVCVHGVNVLPTSVPHTTETSFKIWSFGILISPISFLSLPTYCHNVYFFNNSLDAGYVSADIATIVSLTVNGIATSQVPVSW